MLRYFLGLDLQVSRGCPYAILDVCGKTVADGWVEGDVSKRVECLSEVLMRYEPGEIAVAIDAPRIPRTSARQWFWRRKRWSGMKAAEKGAGRHCEIVVAAHNLANPQWTPASGPYPQWMQLGFVFFERIGTEYA